MCSDENPTTIPCTPSQILNFLIFKYKQIPTVYQMFESSLENGREKISKQREKLSPEEMELIHETEDSILNNIIGTTTEI